MRYVFLTVGHLSNAGYMRARQLGKALLDQGASVGYVADDIPENRGEKNGIDPRADVAFVAHPRGIKQFFQRRRALRSLKPDYVELMGPRPKVMATIAGMRGFKVVGVWDEPEFVKDNGFLNNAGTAVLHTWLRKRADVRIVCARELQHIFRDRYGQETFYMPHAFYLPQFPDGPSMFDKPTVVYMGNFHALWDQDLLFGAFALLARDNFKPPIVMMGGGPDVEKWQAFIKSNNLDNVTMAGFMTGEPLFQRLRHAHVLLFPIRATVINKTRCPSKTFAYAQARRPVICNKVGELPEVLGEHATYVEPTPQAFADAIRASINAPRAADIDYGFERHSWANRAAGLLKELNCDVTAR